MTTDSFEVPVARRPAGGSWGCLIEKKNRKGANPATKARDRRVPEWLLHVLSIAAMIIGFVLGFCVSIRIEQSTSIQLKAELNEVLKESPNATAAEVLAWVKAGKPRQANLAAIPAIPAQTHVAQPGQVMNTVIQGEVIDEPSDSGWVGDLLAGNRDFNEKIVDREWRRELLGLLRAIRRCLRLGLLLMFIGLVLLVATGCKEEQAWALTEKDRQRTAEELEKSGVVAPEKLGAMRVIVFDRPRTKPETIAKGYAAAVARVDMERVALAAAESRFHAGLQSPTNPAGTGEAPADLKLWHTKVQRARRILLVAKAAQDATDYLPVLDRLVADELSGTPANFPTTPIPAADAQRVDRARRAFAAFLQGFEGVTP